MTTRLLGSLARTFCNCLLTFSVVHGVALSQSLSTSQISGTVSDPAGLVMRGVEITLISQDTGILQTVHSDGTGFYALLDLHAGKYELRATQSGFRSYLQSGIDLQVGLNPRINIRLEIGAESQEIKVFADASMVETQSLGVGQVIDGQRIVDLPLNGRQVYQLVTLAGAAVSGPAIDSRHYPTDGVFSVAGGQKTGTNFLMDGGWNMDTDANFGLPTPFPDAVAEFKVETSALAANFGSHPGGAVNVITKSGTRVFHGDAFEFVRNYVFNARNYFAATRDSLKRNQFGGTLGGPIKKDSLFFFAGYQGTILRSDPATNTSFVATPAVLAGDFTTVLSPACNSGKQITATGPFVGNKINPSKFNSVAVNLITLIPVSSDPCGKLVYSGVPNNTVEHQGIGRIDWQQRKNNTIFGRWFVADYALPPHYTNNLLTSTTVGLGDRAQSAIAGDTWTINQSAINVFRGTFTRSRITRIEPNGVPTLTQLGANVYSPIPNYTGQVSATGYFSLGGIGGYFANNTLNLSDDVNLTRGGHQIIAGVNWVHTQLNGVGPFQQNPRYTFSGSITGNALTDFFVGSPSTFLQGNGQIGYDRMNAPSLFAQDTWRVSERLTLIAGLRWDPFYPQHNIKGVASIYKPDQFTAGNVSKVFTAAPPGIFFPGDKGFPGMSNTFEKVWFFMPRLGFIYDPGGKGREVIRAGYGVFSDMNYTWLMQHVPLNPPWGETITINAPAGGLTNPWQGYPGGNPFPTPTPLPSNYPFPIGGTFVFMPVHVKPTYVQQWNLTVEKQIGQNWHIAGSFLGNKITHLWLSHEVNPASYIQGNCTAGQYGLTTAGPCSTLANTNQRRALYLQNPATGQYFGSISQVDDGATGVYDGLLLTVQRRLSRGMTFLANYTLSHCISDGDQSNAGDITNQYQDPNNRHAEWGNCTLDRRNIFNLSLIAATPRFEFRPLRLILSNWQGAGIFTASSGAPLNVTTGTDNALRGEVAIQDRPNLVGKPAVTTPTINAWFNTSAFAKAATGSYGNLGRNTVLGPGAWNLDASISRSFPVREVMRVEFRAEAFNAFNHTRLGNPGTTLSSTTTFGKITSALDPRIVQLGGKLVF
jgi:Carboxypeptidase regulatory-like domain/TonB dependent receptor